MPSQWDHKADKSMSQDLLLAIIESGNLRSIDWPAISVSMAAKAYTFTHEACRQHYQKIRREARGGAPPTPVKAAPNGKAAPAARRAKAVGTAASTFADDDEEGTLHRAKRARTAKSEKMEEDLGGFAGQTAGQFKVENGDSPIVLDDDEDDLYD